MKASKFGIFGVMAILLLGLFAVSAVAVDMTVKVNSDVIDANTLNDVERGDKLDIQIAMKSSENISDARLEVALEGYEHDELRDVSDMFDITAGHVQRESFSLDLPADMKSKEYTLWITLRNNGNEIVNSNYKLYIKTADEALTIKDVVFSPEENVKAGRSLLATVRIENTGAEDQDGVKVKVAIPELGISASDYIDAIEADDEKAQKSFT